MCIKEMKAGNLEVKIFNTRKLMGKAAAHDAAERIRSLLKQKEEINIFCIVPAKTKAEAVYNTIMGKVTEKCPASILKTHKNAVLYADADSGSRVLA
jgi:6-phosphogluconolactonase/glucosamine-6-phosphate isomerase/deaminase